MTTDEHIGLRNLLNINLIRYNFFFCVGEDFVGLVLFRGRFFLLVVASSRARWIGLTVMMGG